MVEYLVKSQVVSIEEHHRTLCKHHQWRDAGVVKFLGIFEIRRWNSGYVSNYFGNYETKNEWEPANYIEYEPCCGLYFKPHLVMVTSDGKRRAKFFDSVVELEKWRDYKFYGVSLIEI